MNGAEEDEIKTAAKAIAADIATALAGVRSESALVTEFEDEQAEAFVAEIGAFMKLTGGGWPTEQREEFIDQATIDLADIPVSILAPTIRSARRRVHDPKRFVSWVVEQAEPEAKRLRTEFELISRLAELARA